MNSLVPTLTLLVAGILGAPNLIAEATLNAPATKQAMQGADASKTETPIILDKPGSTVLSANPKLMVQLAEANQRLQESKNDPVVRRLNDVSNQMRDMDKDNEEKKAALTKEYQQLSQQPAVKEYYEATSRLRAVQEEIEDENHEKIFSRAKTIYSRRHQELQKLAESASPNPANLGMDILSYPRVDGSTSTQPLATIACCRILGSDYAWNYTQSHGRMMPREVAGYRSEIANLFVLARTGFLDNPRNDEFTLASTYPQASIAKSGDPKRLPAIINGLLVRNAGTHEAYLNLINGKSDLALLARKPSKDEQAQAEKQGAKLQITPIAWDALVFIVHEKNPVTGVTQDQARSIYSYQVTNWKELNGNDRPIIAFRREKNSGSQELFEELLLNGNSMPPLTKTSRYRRGELIGNGMGGPFNQLFGEPDGIGFSVFCYEHFMAASPFTRVLNIDGVEPTLTSIGTGKYPLRFPVYAVCRESEPQDSTARRLLQWLLTDKGQNVIKESGLAPIHAASDKPR